MRAARLAVNLHLMPLWWRYGRPEELTVRPVHDGTSIALLLVWADTTHDATAMRTQDFRDAAALYDAEALLRMLRAELLHVADMLDPGFDYDPTLPHLDGGPSQERLVRDRYRAVWDASVAGRLARRGLTAADAREEARMSFAAAFPMLGPDADAAFARFFDGEARSHAEFLAFAERPLGDESRAGLGPGGRCPLCRFPTYAPEPDPVGLEAEAVTRIVADFPRWRTADGLCRQCADLYRAMAMSESAAAMLPG